MNLPLTIDLALVQEDFIQVEIMEEMLDAQLVRQARKKTFVYQTIFCLILAVILGTQSWISNFALIFPAMFFLFFFLHFLYQYIWGYKTDLNHAISHMVESDRQGNTFFTPEEGMAIFYADKCEYLTNEQRRYFTYDDIAHYKISKRLIIFVMKPTKRKDMRNFLFMIIPVRNIPPEILPQFQQFCIDLAHQHNISQWIGPTVFD